MARVYDAIIIGGGHNGLVTAAYLAKAGLQVLVLERRHVLGGCAVTEEIFPGFKYSVCSYVVSLLRPEIIRDLELPKHGLEILPLVASFTPGLDGRYVLRTDDAEETRRELSKWSKLDAEAYPEFGRHMTRIARFVKPVLSTVPPRPDSLSVMELMKMAEFGRNFRHMSAQQRYEMIKLFTMSAVDFLDEWIETEMLKATMSVSGIIGTFLGVRSPGTAYVLLHHYMGEIDGVSRSWGFAKGGMGGISNSIANSARSFGAEIRSEAGVAQILVRDGRSVGVVLENGEEIMASVVASSLDPNRTFLKLIEARHLDGDFVSQVKNYKLRGSSGKVNLAVDRLPNFTCLPGMGKHLRGDLAIAPSIDYLERAYDQAKYGEFSTRPYINMVIPSLTDPTVAPPGKHVVSCFVQYAPYKLKDNGNWDDQREAFGDTVVDTLEEYAPGLKASILHRQVLTPLDLEREFGLTEGNIFHGELSREQLFFLRPVPGWAQYRTPLRNLYLCGSGAHPGGGVMGGPGALAAREIISDLKLPETEVTMSYDVIVIGAGHNGLVAAATLATGGKQVIVLEQRHDLGGRIATEEPWPGYRVSTGLHSVGRLRPRIVKELDLDVDIVPHDPVVFAPQPDGRYLALWQDVRRSVRELTRFSKLDASRYADYVAFMRRLANFAAPILDLKPPPLDAPDLPQLFELANLGVRFRMLGRNDMIRAMRMAPMRVADFVGEWFETDALKAALAAPALWGLFCGPWSSGTGATLIYHALEGPLGAPSGGTGEMAEALAVACLKAGVEIRRASQVEEILVDGSRVRGVRLAGGDVVEAEYVFSSLDPKRTFMHLMPPTTINPGFARQVRNYKSRGVTARINLALDGLPEFACLEGLKGPDVERLLRGRIHIGPSLDYLEKAFDAAKYGRYAREPMVEMVIPTLSDPTLAPKGQHILSMLVQWAPYHLREGQWDDLRGQFADDVLKSLDPYLPGLSNRIVQRQVLTPLDMERNIGLTEGHIHHGEHSLHQLFFSRPVPALAQYSCEVENLYLCGAGGHPGGGITGAAGSNAAHALLDADLTPGERARVAARPAAKGLAVLGAGLAVGMAVRALTRSKSKGKVEEKTDGNSDSLS